VQKYASSLPQVGLRGEGGGHRPGTLLSWTPTAQNSTATVRVRGTCLEKRGKRGKREGGGKEKKCRR